MQGPTKQYTKEKVNEIVGYVIEGMSPIDAALATGVTSETYHKWIREHPQFKDTLDIAKAQARLEALRVLKLLAETSPQAAVALMERVSPKSKFTELESLTHLASLGWIAQEKVDIVNDIFEDAARKAGEVIRSNVNEDSTPQAA